MKKIMKWILISVLAIILIIPLLPVDFDAGGCGGGYRKDLSDLYKDKFQNLFLEGNSIPLVRKDNVLINNSELMDNMRWKGRTIRTKATIKFNGNNYLVEYEGKRYWFDKYNWKIKSIKHI